MLDTAATTLLGQKIITHEQLANELDRSPKWVIEQIIYPPEGEGVPSLHLGNFYVIDRDEWEAWATRNSRGCLRADKPTLRSPPK